MTGKELTLLMCRYKVTIRELAKRMQVTQTDVRYRRETGLNHPELARDWIQAIIGTDPGRQTRGEL